MCPYLVFDYYYCVYNIKWTKKKEKQKLSQRTRGEKNIRKLVYTH